MIKIIPWLISFVAMIGAVLNIQKDVLGFYIWVCSNLSWIVYILYYKQKNLYGQILLWLIFTGLSIWGIFSWS
jgi:peptidoglycan biosynthesis protein MviN/MurJ (putative lipid II flippase)